MYDTHAAALVRGLAAWGSSSGCYPALKGRGVAQATPHRQGQGLEYDLYPVDLAGWLQHRYCAADVLVVKLDIEGGEWELLEHLLRRGAAPLIDFLAVEWHLGQRALTAAERGPLRERKARIELHLAQACVRLLRAWEAEPLSHALSAKASASAPVGPAAAARAHNRRAEVQLDAPAHRRPRTTNSDH